MRTRSHIIEDESRIQLEQIIPNYWVCRDKSKDYGIDCEIEIFDKKGNSSGKVFWVQLKATDSKTKRGIQSISFPIKKILQFKSYELPVLILRYSTEEKSFYGRWANSIDLYGIKKSAKSVSVKFADSDNWDKSIFNSIEHYLDKVKYIRGNKINSPLKTLIKILHDSNISLPRPVFVSKLKTHLKAYNGLIDFEQEDNLSLAEIIFGKNQIRFNLSDEGGAFIKHNLQYNSDDDYELVSKYILAGLSICLCHAGQTDYGTRIILKTNLFPFLAKNKEMLIYLLPHLINGSYFEESLDEISKIIADDKDDNLIQIYTQTCLLLSSNVNVEKQEAFLKAQIEKAFEFGREKIIGISYYNLGNHYRSRFMNSKALENYLKAKRFFAAYLKQSYFVSELAGIMHDLGKYGCASILYSKAIELDDSDLRLKALLADSVMFTGEYKKALELFDSYLIETANKDYDNDEWNLKYSCLATLLENDYPESQNRDSEKAYKLADVTKINSGVKEQLEQAISYDMLCGYAWFNLGIEYYSNGDNIGATIAFTMCALLQNSDLEAWANATGCAFSDNSTISMFFHIVRLGYFYNEDEYVIELHKRMVKSSKTATNEYFDLIDKIISEKRNSTKTIRLIEDKDSHNEIVFETK